MSWCFHGRHRHPLPDDAVADDVLLDGDCVVGLGVTLQEVVGGARVVHPGAGEDPGAGGVDPRRQDAPDLLEVPVGEDVPRWKSADRGWW